jgi:hypothetical protein
MRIIRILLITIICTILYSCTNKVSLGNKTDVVIEFLIYSLSKNKLDSRMYNPPPPPEVADSLYEEKKHDTIIKSLKPLKIYLNSNILRDSSFKHINKPPKGFHFLKKLSTSKNYKLPLKNNLLKNSSPIIFIPTTDDDFTRRYDSIRFMEDYGGLISFQNLIFSEKGKKAYFEISFFKSKLNASTSAVYAEWVDGNWKFIVIPISIS